MNVKTTIAALQPLEGHRIAILANTYPRAFIHAQHCITVDHLPPDQRQVADQGNIILWNGYFTKSGLQAGITFWAKAIRTITWSHDHIIADIRTHRGTKISIIKLWRLSQNKQQ